MKLYTVHIRPGEAGAAQKPVFVREGFSLWAFLFTFFWALYHRLWPWALLILACNIMLMVMGNVHLLSPAGTGILQLGFNVLVGFHANDWLRGKLARNGYILADIAAGDSLLRAEQRYFERYLAVVGV